MVHRDREEMVGAGTEGGDGESVFWGDRVSIWGGGKFWRWRVGVVTRQCESASCR